VLMTASNDLLIVATSKSRTSVECVDTRSPTKARCDSLAFRSKNHPHLKGDGMVVGVSYRRGRDMLRDTLIDIGFFKLQDSVWIYPYDCEDLITLLKTNYSMSSRVLYIVSEHVEGDWKAKKYFKLST